METWPGSCATTSASGITGTLGLGRRLYETFENAARERGAVALKAITAPENEASVAFHQRVGFTEMMRVQDYGGSVGAKRSVAFE